MKKKSQLVDDGSPIMKTNQFYLRLHSIGMLDEKGKSVMGMRGWDRFDSDPDEPLSNIAVRVVKLLSDYCRYSSVKAMRKDVKQFKLFISGLKVVDLRKSKKVVLAE